jgi:hypothetical protein
MMLENSMGSVELSYGRKRSGVTRVIAYKHALHALKAVSSESFFDEDSHEEDLKD